MITLVYTYYENGGMLERHFQEWANYAPEVKEQMRAMIVDDGSPHDYAEKHAREVGFPIEFYRIKENIPWNVAGARNLGMHVAPDGWCLLTDIDHVLKVEWATFLLNDVRTLLALYKGYKQEFYYTFERRWADGRALHPHPNSFVIDRSLYWKIGGCDEDWSGWWGAGEQVFRRCLNVFAREMRLAVILTHYGRDDIPDASTREWGRKNSPWDWRNNPKLVEKARRAPYKPERPLRFHWERVV